MRLSYLAVVLMVHSLLCCEPWQTLLQSHSLQAILPDIQQHIAHRFTRMNKKPLPISASLVKCSGFKHIHVPLHGKKQSLL